MFCTIINDCRDTNAAGRQATRAISLLECPASFISIKNDLEAAGNLIDALDAAEQRKGVVLVNVAPRHGASRKWGNGTPFGYFYYGETLVIISVEGFTLSLAKKLGVTDSINLLDTSEAAQAMQEHGFIPEGTREYIAGTQFRSYDFTPRAAAFLLEGNSLPSTEWSLENVTDLQNVVWWIDNFGNCKTTLLREEVEIDEQGMIETAFGPLPFYEQLKEVPDGKAAIVSGSSGLEEKRFLELVVQGGSAAERFRITLGNTVT